MRSKVGPLKRVQTLLDVTCPTGKRSYADFHGAKELARRTGRDRDQPMQPYRCDRCRHWHVGSHQLGHGPRRPRVEHNE
jgi:hypothetical protein